MDSFCPTARTLPMTSTLLLDRAATVPTRQTSRLLLRLGSSLTLTGRPAGRLEPLPACGIPRLASPIRPTIFGPGEPPRARLVTFMRIPAPMRLLYWRRGRRRLEGRLMLMYALSD